MRQSTRFASRAYWGSSCSQVLWTNLGTRWGHKRGVLWTNLWGGKLLEIHHEIPCALRCFGRRTLPRRREAHPIRRATGGSIRRGNSPDQASGQLLDKLDRRGNPGGSTCGEAQRCPARLRPGRRPSGRQDQPSGRSKVHPRVNHRRPLQCLVGGAFLRLSHSARSPSRSLAATRHRLRTTARTPHARGRYRQTRVSSEFWPQVGPIPGAKSRSEVGAAFERPQDRTEEPTAEPPLVLRAAAIERWRRQG